MNKKIISIFAISLVAVAMTGFTVWDHYGPLTVNYSEAVLLATPLELAEKADYAIVGKVIDMKSIRVQMPNPGDDDMVFTDITLDVKKDLFENNGDETIVFRIVGGEADNMRMHGEDAPKFHLNEKVLVYITEGTPTDGYPFYGTNYLVGGAQGVFEIDDNKGKSKDKFMGHSFDSDKLQSDSKDKYKNKDKK